MTKREVSEMMSFIGRKGGKARMMSLSRAERVRLATKASKAAAKARKLRKARQTEAERDEPFKGDDYQFDDSPVEINDR